MDDLKFIKDYLNRYKESLFETDVSDQVILVKQMLLKLKNNGRKIMIAGNGGSAAISSHAAVDFTKQGGIRSINFNEADLLTCFSNDYGYENWVQKALSFYADKGDLLVCISSSGKSMNIINGAKFAKKMGCKVITLTGFNKKNQLRQTGNINLWLNSRNYNLIEMTHHIWLLSIVDFIAKAKFNN